jgi:hypothetical protein
MHGLEQPPMAWPQMEQVVGLGWVVARWVALRLGNIGLRGDMLSGVLGQEHDRGRR